MSDPRAILRRAHMSDSGAIRSRAARIVTDLDDLLTAMDHPDDDGQRQRARLLAALQRERFTPIHPRPTTTT